MARRNDPNMKFLKGGIVFFVLIAIVVIFTYQSIVEVIKKNSKKMDCLISLSEDFSGKNLSFYANDSLLYKGEPVDPDSSFLVPAISKNVSLMVYTNDSVFVDSCALEKGCNYKLKYNDGDIEVVELAK